jgi:hypothetical protein
VARLRSADPAPDVDTLDVPARLATCVVEDWVRPDERPPAGWYKATRNGVPRAQATGEFAFWCQIRAWRGWQEARRVWAAEHGVPAVGELLPLGRPVFRDGPAGWEVPGGPPA